MAAVDETSGEKSDAWASQVTIRTFTFTLREMKSQQVFLSRGKTISGLHFKVFARSGLVCG